MAQGILCDWTRKWNPPKDVQSPFPWPTKHVENSDTLQGCESCSRVCMFSEETYERLLRFSNGNVSLGEQFLERLKADSLYPIVHTLYYEVRNDPSKLYLFSVKDFIEGTNQRLAKLLDHIRGCILNFGERNVLIR